MSVCGSACLLRVCVCVLSGLVFDFGTILSVSSSSSSSLCVVCVCGGNENKPG